ncbi:hypothetical protein JCM8097_006962 [Rhodosporidiobolus ruineniae]
MPLSFYDDVSPTIAYSTSWATLGSALGEFDYYNASTWYSGSWHSCAADSATQSSGGCNATITFEGPGSITVLGDYNRNHRRFYCILDDGDDERWFWRNGSTLVSGANSTMQFNHTRCAVSGLEAAKTYTLTFGQLVDDTNSNGIALDYYILDNSTAASSTLTWSSDFIAASPDTDYSWTTQTSTLSSAMSTSALSSSASSSSANPSASSSSSSSGSSATAIGVGVGVGVGCGLGLALLGGWFIFRRLRRNRGSEDGMTVATSPHPGNARTPSTVPSPGGAGGWGGSNGSEQGGVAYSSPGGYAPPMSEYGRHSQSQFGGVPEVQEHVVPYNSPTVRSSGAASSGLDSPYTFRER